MKIEDNENKEFLNEDEDLLYDELDENSYDHSSNEIESDIESGDENYSEEIKLVEDDDDEEEESGRIVLSEKEIDQALDDGSNNEIQIKKVIYYCPEYDDIRNNKVKVWSHYDDRIKKTLKVMSYWKNYDIDDLYQQGYLFFDDLCNIYIPYYGGKFYPFDRYIFKNLIIKLRAYIQNYYLKGKREQPVDITEKHDSAKICDDIGDTEEKIFIDYIYSMLDERQRDILEYTYQGYKQQEVGEILNISQSRVSVIKKKTLKILQDVLAEEEAEDNDKK